MYTQCPHPGGTVTLEFTANLVNQLKTLSLLNHATNVRDDSLLVCQRRTFSYPASVKRNEI